MSGNACALTLICGAAVLAGWVDTRFPRLAPQSFMGAGLHMIASMFAVQLGMTVLGAAAREPLPVMTALFGAALPATMYLIISAFWVLKLLHGLVGGAVR